MNRNVYTLLTAAILASVLNVARAETMAERKQRIMRRYMRERQDIMQSDLEVPDAAQEDARVVGSERFKELAQDFQRQEGGRMPRVVQPNQPVPLKSERSWWLETAEMEEDSFADPFSSKTDAEDGSAESWSPWGKRDDSSSYGGGYGQQRDGRGNAYPGSRENSSFYGGAYDQQRDGRGKAYPDSQSAYGMQNESGNESSVWGMTYDGYTSRSAPTSRESDRMPGFYGKQQTDTRGLKSERGLDAAGRYGPLPSTGILQSPYSAPSATQDRSSQNQTSGYTPYRNPYQVQGDEQRRYGGNLQPPPQYSRPNNYQKWKDTNKAWDPSAGNSYLDELMRNERR